MWFVFIYVLFLMLQILEAWDRKEMKSKDLEICLNLEFKFTIGIKRTIYSSNSQKQFYKWQKILSIWLKLYREFIESVLQIRWGVASSLHAQFFSE